LLSVVAVFRAPASRSASNGYQYAENQQNAKDRPKHLAAAKTLDQGPEVKHDVYHA
jgi:hypothetical protein